MVEQWDCPQRRPAGSLAYASPHNGRRPFPAPPPNRLASRRSLSRTTPPLQHGRKFLELQPLPRRGRGVDSQDGSAARPHHAPRMNCRRPPKRLHCFKSRCPVLAPAYLGTQRSSATIPDLSAGEKGQGVVPVTLPLPHGHLPPGTSPQADMRYLGLRVRLPVAQFC
jgi:hypothetical protein